MVMNTDTYPDTDTHTDTDSGSDSVIRYVYVTFSPQQCLSVCVCFCTQTMRIKLAIICCCSLIAFIRFYCFSLSPPATHLSDHPSTHLAGVEGAERTTTASAEELLMQSKLEWPG